MQSELVGRKIRYFSHAANRAEQAAPDLTKKVRPIDDIMRVLLRFCGIASVFTTIGIVVVLGSEALRFFTSDQVSLGEFFTSITWQPQGGHFGILPLLNATLMTSVIAMLFALPLGLGGAINMME